MKVKIIVERHPDGFVAYPLGLKGVVIGQGDSCEEAMADVQSAIRFHIETFGKDVLLKAMLRERLQSVEERITAACRRAGRGRDQVTLVAVTKTVAAEMAALVPQLGVLDLGENRPQELWRKAAALPGTVRWHLIGHLQRNKIEQTLPLVRLIHSVDSVRLLQALEASPRPGPIDVLLEVNASGEASKHGFAPAELAGLAPALQPLQHVRVLGLMTMAALEDDPERCRPTFRLLRELRDQLAGKLGPPHLLQHLSMGMSNDFEVAIEEGATLVRIGSELFRSHNRE